MRTDRGRGLGIVLTGGNDNGGTLDVAFVLAAGSAADRIECVPSGGDIDMDRAPGAGSVLGALFDADDSVFGGKVGVGEDGVGLLSAGNDARGTACFGGAAAAGAGCTRGDVVVLAAGDAGALRGAGRATMNAGSFLVGTGSVAPG